MNVLRNNIHFKIQDYLRICLGLFWLIFITLPLLYFANIFGPDSLYKITENFNFICERPYAFCLSENIYFNYMVFGLAYLAAVLVILKKQITISSLFLIFFLQSLSVKIPEGINVSHGFLGLITFSLIFLDRWPDLVLKWLQVIGLTAYMFAGLGKWLSEGWRSAGSCHVFQFSDLSFLCNYPSLSLALTYSVIFIEGLCLLSFIHRRVALFFWITLTALHASTWIFFNFKDLSMAMLIFQIFIYPYKSKNREQPFFRFT